MQSATKHIEISNVTIPVVIFLEANSQHVLPNSGIQLFMDLVLSASLGRLYNKDTNKAESYGNFRGSFSYFSVSSFTSIATHIITSFYYLLFFFIYLEFIVLSDSYFVFLDLYN